jgi:hypothetical protein
LLINIKILTNIQFLFFKKYLTMTKKINIIFCLILLEIQFQHHFLIPVGIKQVNNSFYSLLNLNILNFKDHHGIEHGFKFNSCSEILDSKNHEYSVLEKKTIMYILHGKEDQFNQILRLLNSMQCVNIRLNII